MYKVTLTRHWVFEASLYYKPPLQRTKNGSELKFNT